MRTIAVAALLVLAASGCSDAQSAAAPADQQPDACTPADLTITDDGGSGAGQHLQDTLGLRTNTTPCAVLAHPNLLMLDRAGMPLPTTVAPGAYQNGTTSPDSTTIPADSTRYVVLVYGYDNPDTGTPCTPVASHLDVTLGPQLTIRIAAPEPDNIPMNPCDGIVNESPVGRTAEVFGTNQ